LEEDDLFKLLVLLKQQEVGLCCHPAAMSAGCISSCTLKLAGKVVKQQAIVPVLQLPPMLLALLV